MKKIIVGILLVIISISALYTSTFAEFNLIDGDIDKTIESFLFGSNGYTYSIYQSTVDKQYAIDNKMLNVDSGGNMNFIIGALQLCDFLNGKSETSLAVDYTEYTLKLASKALGAVSNRLLEIPEDAHYNIVKWVSERYSNISNLKEKTISGINTYISQGRNKTNAASNIISNDTTSGITVNDVFDKKINYSEEQIKNYLLTFGDYLGNLTQSEKVQIINTWKKKIGENEYNKNVLGQSAGINEILDAEYEKTGDKDITNNQIIYQIPNRIPAEDTDSDKTKSTDLDSIIESADTFIKNGEDDEKIKETDIQNLSNTIYNILLIVGIIIAVIVGAIIGIKFMVGSVEEKANIKEILVPYIVGCVVVFGAFGIWKLAVTILAGI